MNDLLRRLDADFQLAMKAFDLFTLNERRIALRTFATLKYPHIEDRFLEAVNVTIATIHAQTSVDRAAAPEGPK